MGSGKGKLLGFWVLQSTFIKKEITEKNGGRGGVENDINIGMATNVVFS